MSTTLALRCLSSRHSFFLPQLQIIRCNKPTKKRFEVFSASQKVALQNKRDDLSRRKEQVKARVNEVKSLAKERMSGYKENVMTIPNLLSLTRIVATPVLGYWVCTESYTAALSLFSLAAVSDLLDGQIARTWPSQQSMIGTLLDPLADKLLVGTLFLTLTYSQLIPLPLTALIILRDTSLVAASFILRYKSLPEPKTLARYFDPSLASMQFQPTFLSKVNTTLQLALVACSLASPVFEFVNHPYLLGLCWLTASTTGASAIEYIVRKDTYKFFKKKKKED